MAHDTSEDVNYPMDSDHDNKKERMNSQPIQQETPQAMPQKTDNFIKLIVTAGCLIAASIILTLLFPMGFGSLFASIAGLFFAGIGVGMFAYSFKLLSDPYFIAGLRFRGGFLRRYQTFSANFNIYFSTVFAVIGFVIFALTQVIILSLIAFAGFMTEGSPVTMSVPLWILYGACILPTLGGSILAIVAMIRTVVIKQPQIKAANAREQYVRQQQQMIAAQYYNQMAAVGYPVTKQQADAYAQQVYSPAPVLYPVIPQYTPQQSIQQQASPQQQVPQSQITPQPPVIPPSPDEFEDVEL